MSGVCTQIRRLTLAGAAILWAGGSQAEPGCRSDAMLVFDGSGSMAEMGFNLLNEPRIFSARRALRRSVPGIAAARRLGLIIYGPGQVGGACGNVDLRFPPMPDAAPRIISEIDALRPDGETPLTEAVRMAAGVLEYKRRPGVVVLVTDGKETCGGAPCQLAAELAAEAADLTVHVIGFKVQSEHFNWPSAPVSEQSEGHTVAQCLADLTGGSYVSTETVDELAAALRQVLGCQMIGQASLSQRKGG
ncbi:vWA domain-containing protein [Marimonas arenosa]|uniref:VWA domain-containing protein n=1 Tax=Marimonas arenosa TaxID=1795305 RepID=A0AAE3W847_9RHOB|nr:VWA domain-containing protein [Marimonas arenosa]MDQ2088366.1 VWA domain-containing protein [Marimonas arenosa]